MSIITQPFKVGVKAIDLLKYKTRQAAVSILMDVKERYKKMVANWIDLFVPKDTGDLRRDMKASTRQGFVQENELFVGIVLCLDSRMSYSQLVNDLEPPVNLRHSKDPLAVYNYFDKCVEKINESLPSMVQLAIAANSDKAKAIGGK